MTAEADDNFFRVYNRQGWYPAKWAHHPQPIKDLIHMIGYRPQVKECWMNCQQFFHANIMFGTGLDLELHSGWARRFMVFEHCWLVFEGEIVDLTVDLTRTPEYLSSYVVTYEELVGHMAKGFYGCTDVERLWELHPDIEAIEKLKQLREGL